VEPTPLMLWVIHYVLAWRPIELAKVVKDIFSYFCMPILDQFGKCEDADMILLSVKGIFLEIISKQSTLERLLSNFLSKNILFFIDKLIWIIDDDFKEELVDYLSIKIKSR
jgi:hypothetical protein